MSQYTPIDQSTLSDVLTTLLTASERLRRHLPDQSYYDAYWKALLSRFTQPPTTNSDTHSETTPDTCSMNAEDVIAKATIAANYLRSASQQLLVGNSLNARQD